MQQASVSGNVLDSTAPVMRRGKERETPKHKKPTPLRKVHGHTYMYMLMRYAEGGGH